MPGRISIPCRQRQKASGWALVDDDRQRRAAGVADQVAHEADEVDLAPERPVEADRGAAQLRHLRRQDRAHPVAGGAPLGRRQGHARGDQACALGPAPCLQLDRAAVWRGHAQLPSPPAGGRGSDAELGESQRRVRDRGAGAHLGGDPDRLHDLLGRGAARLAALVWPVMQ